MKLHLGCGNTHIDGFVNVDIQASPTVDVVSDVKTLGQFTAGTASLIYACHVLEHFSHDEVPVVLKRWREILKPDGEIRISVPDIDKIVKVYLDNWKHFQTPPNTPWIGLLYGGQGTPYDYHKTGFNLCWLKYLMEKEGYRDIEEYPHHPHWLGISDASLANAPFGAYLSLNVKARK
jgi:SAM-dependent methyltransferase